MEFNNVRMWQRVFPLLTALALLLSLFAVALPSLAVPVSAAEVVASGSCGDALTWVFTDDGVLTISGSGAMPDYSISNQPWYDYKSSITSVVFSSGVTHVGNYAFYNFKALASVVLPAGLETIGNYCFYSTALVSVSIPSSVLSIGNAAFCYCYSLKSVYLSASSPPTVGISCFQQENDLRCLRGIFVPDYAAYYGYSNWASYDYCLYETGQDPYWPSENVSDFYDEYYQDDAVLTRYYRYDCALDFDTYTSAYGYINGGLLYFNYNQLGKTTKVFDLRELVVDSIGYSITTDFTYTASNASTKTYDGVTMYVSFFDALGALVYETSVDGHDGVIPAGTNTLTCELTGVFPDGAVYAHVYVSIVHTGQTYSASALELTFAVDYEPVVIPETPVVTSDFGGEVSYTRGKAAKPLNVSASVTDDGVLSYQWYRVSADDPDTAYKLPDTDASYTPPTDAVGIWMYYCEVTNTLGSLSSSTNSDFIVVTVERPPLGYGYKIYNFKDYITDSSVSGTDKMYTVTFPMSGIYTELHGGYNGEYALVDYWEGTDFRCDIPASAMADDTYEVKLMFYPLGHGAQPNVLKLNNIASGIDVSFRTVVDFGCDFYTEDNSIVFYWYDAHMELLGTSPLPLTHEDVTDGHAYSVDFTVTKPSGAEYCAYAVVIDDMGPEENMDFDVRIVSSSLRLTMSAFDDISGGIEDANDKLDEIGGAVDEILTGGDAGDDLIAGGDKIEQAGESLGENIGVIQDFEDQVMSGFNDNLDDVIAGADLTFLVAPLAFVQKYTNEIVAGIPSQYLVIFTLPALFGLFFYIVGHPIRAPKPDTSGDTVTRETFTETTILTGNHAGESRSTRTVTTSKEIGRVHNE